MLSRLSAEGGTFRNALTAQDLAAIRLARNWFHASQYLPCLLYYAGASDAQPRFPATISHTIRKGIPKLAHHVSWLIGWWIWYGVLQRRGSASVRLFAQQMFATGIVTTFICGVGQGKISNRVHFVGAGFYMLDHIVLLSLLDTARSYQVGFYASFMLMVGAIKRSKALELDIGLGSEDADLWDEEQRSRQLAKAPAPLRRKLWWTELCIMVFENALFTSFIAGMTSALPGGVE
jgi:hypothetical protein